MHTAELTTAGPLSARARMERSDRVHRALAQARIAAELVRPEPIAVNELLEELEDSARLSAEARKLRLTITPLASALTIDSDREILSSMLSLLLQNAFTYTRPHSHVWLEARATLDHVRLEIEDQCGGLSAACRPPHDPHADAGVALCGRGAALLRGALHVGNRNRGCLFTVELPRAPW